MFIGGLRHRLTILRPVQARNSRQEMITTWQSWRTVWGSVLPEDGREYYRTKQENAELHGLIGIRYLPGLIELAKSGAVRITFKGRTHEVIWVRDWQERRTEMRIAYKEAQ